MSKIGSSINNMITAPNDYDFVKKTIGNWVVYTDGNGTCAYSPDKPVTGDEDAKVTVGATPGTYTGSSLPTSAIATFVNGSSYYITARIYIPSAKNNWTKISILPVDLASWSKVREVTATLTIEDGWQDINAVYTADADITGKITIKGESVTDGDMFYFDDIIISKT